VNNDRGRERNTIGTHVGIREHVSARKGGSETALITDSNDHVAALGRWIHDLGAVPL